MFTNDYDTKSYYMNQRVPLNEAYFGKTKGVQEIEACVRKLKEKYDDRFYDVGLDYDPMKFELERTIENVFGFGAVNIQFVRTDEQNACTLSLGSRIDTWFRKGTLIVSTSEGYKFNKEANYAAYFIMYTGLFYNPKFSAEEVTAILLHEIGHNFTPAQDMTQNIMNKAELMLHIAASLLSLLVNPMNAPAVFRMIVYGTSNVGTRLLNFIDKTIDTTPIIRDVAGITNTVFGMIDNINMQILMIIDTFVTIINPFLSIGKVIIATPVFLVKGILSLSGIGYTDEQYADSFATMYGYGPALSSALEKITIGDQGMLANMMLEQVPFLANYVELMRMPFNILLSMCDEHPELVARMNNCLRQMEEDANNRSYSPKMKKRLKQDIVALRKALSVYEASSKKYNDTSTDPYAVRRNWQKTLNTMFSGGDIRHRVYTRSSPKEINRRFKELLGR